MTSVSFIEASPRAGITSIINKQIYGSIPMFRENREPNCYQVYVDDVNFQVRICKCRDYGFKNYIFHERGIIVFILDITNKDSINEIKERYLSCISCPDCIYLVGNKCDLIESRQIEFEMVADLIDYIKKETYLTEDDEIKYFETSAFDGTGIEELFSAIANKITQIKNHDYNNYIETTKLPNDDSKKKRCQIQ